MWIGVDWGTSNFRAYRMDADGAVVARHASARGIAAVSGGAFEDALEAEIGPWLDGAPEIVLSGMITSRNGWVETPYADVPARLFDLARLAVLRTGRTGARLTFLPGVAARGADPDVMRGEEIQVFGAVPDGFDGVVVLPGTHSKWVAVRGGAIRDFATYLSGEVYALVLKHSIVGRLVPEGAGEDAAAFARGIALARNQRAPGDLLHDLFTARSRALLGDLDASAIPDFVSGLLIGAEIGAALARTGAAEVLVVGEAALTQRYLSALAWFGVAAAAGPAEASVAGYRRLLALTPP